MNLSYSRYTPQFLPSHFICLLVMIMFIPSHFLAMYLNGIVRPPRSICNRLITFRMIDCSLGSVVLRLHS